MAESSHVRRKLERGAWIAVLGFFGVTGVIGLIVIAWPRGPAEPERPASVVFERGSASVTAPVTAPTSAPVLASVGVAASARASADGAGAVPPGHAIVVFRPGPSPSVETTHSGMVVVNLGGGGNGEASLPMLLDAADAAVKKKPTTVAWVAEGTKLTDVFEGKESGLLRAQSSVLWMLQRRSLDGWVEAPEKLQELLRRIYRVTTRREGADPKRHVVAIADDRWPNARAVITLLQELDLATHVLGYQESALIEVKRPDGSFVIGVPGAPYERLRGTEAKILDWNREKDQAEAAGGEAGKARLRAIEGREREHIAEVLKRGGGTAAPDISLENRRLRALMAEVAGQQGFDRSRSLYEALLEEGTLLYLSSMSPGAGKSGDFNPNIEVRSIDHPGLGRVIVAFTDRDAFDRAKIHGDDLVAISGRKLFAYAMSTKQGVLINHAGPNLVGVVGPTLEALARGELPSP